MLYAVPIFHSPLTHERVVQLVARFALGLLSAVSRCVASSETMETEAFFTKPLKPFVDAEVGEQLTIVCVV